MTVTKATAATATAFKATEHEAKTRFYKTTLSSDHLQVATHSNRNHNKSYQSNDIQQPGSKSQEQQHSKQHTFSTATVGFTLKVVSLLLYRKG